MKIVWDEPKRLANIDKHGLDLADLTEAFFADALFLPSKEKRWRGIGTNARTVADLVVGNYFVQIRHFNTAGGTGDYSIAVRRM